LHEQPAEYDPKDAFNPDEAGLLLVQALTRILATAVHEGRFKQFMKEARCV
jgi:hypothetical protein